MKTRTNKYRILEHVGGYRNTYEVQRKGFLWIWHEAGYFATEQCARDAVNRYCKPKEVNIINC